MFRQRLVLLISFFLSSAVLTACVSYVDLKNEEPIASFVVSEGYQPVYRKLLNKARECAFPGHVILGDLFVDTRTARIISQSSKASYAQFTFYIIDIQHQSETATRVNIRSWGENGKKLAAALPDWARDPNSPCYGDNPNIKESS